MALIDTAAGVNSLLSSLGMSSSFWDLAQGSFTIPKSDNNPEEVTLTFLDILPALQASITPSSITNADQVIDLIRRQKLNGADGSGDTYFVNDTVSFTNNLISYQLPNSNEIIIGWGNKKTSFSIAMILCNAGYIAKAQKIAELFSQNLGMNGGVLHHPIFGTFNNTFVQSYSLTSGKDIFNGSVCVVNFVTPNLFNVSNAPQAPLASRLITNIQTINSILVGISNLPTIQSQLESLANNPLFKNPSAITLQGRFLVDTYTTQIGFPASPYPAVVAVKENIDDINPLMANASEELEANNIPTDYDIYYQVQVILELLCQIGNVVVDRYGNGGLSEVTTSTELYNEQTAVGIVYTQEYVNVYGQLVQIERQIQSINDGVYTVLVTTTITTSVSRSDSFSYIRSLINNMIVAANVYGYVYPTHYTEYASLIANVEIVYNSILAKEGNTFKVPYDMPLFRASQLTGISTAQLLVRNADLVGHRPLVKGMELYL